MDDRIEFDGLIREGEIEAYVETKIFGNTIDTLELHVDRKAAVADTLRYSILWLLYEYKELPRSMLVQATGKQSNGLHHHLRELLNNNLIAEVAGPEDGDKRTSYYRITKLGEQEIEADVMNITGEDPENLHPFIVEDQPIKGVDSSGTSDVPVEVADPIAVAPNSGTEEVFD